jgi:hypothetical protein
LTSTGLFHVEPFVLDVLSRISPVLEKAVVGGSGGCASGVLPLKYVR